MGWSTSASKNFNLNSLFQIEDQTNENPSIEFATHLQLLNSGQLGQPGIFGEKNRLGCP